MGHLRKLSRQIHRERWAQLPDLRKKKRIDWLLKSLREDTARKLEFLNQQTKPPSLIRRAVTKVVAWLWSVLSRRVR